jgi:serine/threonine-protein kinase
MIGQTISHYRVTEKLGAGGMGEVYRATDTKLNRDVALKVLPPAFAADADRMARFQREAQVLASLNHPHIATIHGLEESSGVRALAMELVDGPTLADRIAQGAIPLHEALPFARQMAEALEYAHERGIIHRDLKPANVKLTTDGKIKILDFGLAKALEDAPSAAAVEHSPTLSIAATKAGIILGTAAYMSPEQAHGRAADGRADIWSFGVTLYEMLSAKPVFTGESVSDTLASVLKFEPDWNALPADVPESIRRLLRRCLTRDPKKRLQAIGEARIAIEEAIANPADTSPATQLIAQAPAFAEEAPLWRRALPWAVAGVSLLALVLSYWRPWQGPPEPKSAVRLSAEIGADASIRTDYGASAVLSPDGRRLAFTARATNQQPQLYLRSMDQLKATVLSGTDGARNPFFSPDGEWIAFFANGKLKKVSAQGGAVVTLCDAPDDRGGSWGDDDRIVFTASTREGLSRVPAAGGTPEKLTELDKNTGEATHRWPQVLPGGKAVLFTTNNITSNFEAATIAVMALDTKQLKTVQRGGSYGRYLPSGHLAYLHEGTLFAAAFNLDRLELTGTPAPAVEGVVSSPTVGGAQFAFSDTGTLLYAPGRSSVDKTKVFWMDREGKMMPLRDVAASYGDPRISPDGTRLTVDINDGANTDVWVYEWKRDTLTRFTFTEGLDSYPVWTPDGRRITFNSAQSAGDLNLYWKRADGAGDIQRLTESKNIQVAYSWSPDGKALAFMEINPATGLDIMILPMEGDEKSGWKPGKPQPFVNTPFSENGAAFSPDGRWLAYFSNESGKPEVYVRPYPGPGGKWQVSTDGGVGPIWSPNGKELFYQTLESKIMVATYTALGASFRAEKPHLWSEVQLTIVPLHWNDALHPDGKRFAVLKAEGTQVEEKRDKVTIIQNFFEELCRIAPKGKK